MSYTVQPNADCNREAVFRDSFQQRFAAVQADHTVTYSIWFSTVPPQ